jgi:DNA topoisomerase-1
MVKKVLERKYVEIKNFEGIDKPYFKLTLNNNFEIDKFTKVIKLGSEKFKLAPTPNGIKVNQWLEEHFKNIMNVDYTAQFEEYLDLIADGKAEWRNVIKQYYNDFSPELDKLNSVVIEKTEKDRILGINESGVEIYAGCKDSPYIKYKSGSKWIYTSIKIENVDHDNITLEQALSLCEYPKLLGKIGRANASICSGPFGFYLKCGLKKISLKSFEDNISDIDLEIAKKIISSDSDPNVIQNFKVKDKTLNIKTGKFGPYIEILGETKQNISIQKEYEPETITLEQVL